MDSTLVLLVGACGGTLALARLLDRAVGDGWWAAAQAVPLAVLAVAATGLALAGQPPTVWLAIGAVAALWIGCRWLITIPPADAGAAAAPRQPRPRAVAVAGLAPLLAVGWVAARPVTPADPTVDEVAAELATPVGLRPLRSLVLATDRGRRVRTYEVAGPLPGGRDPAELEALFLRHWGAGHQLIRQDGPDPRSNCHGWTFAGGRCWLQSDEAEAILRENGYRPADPPRTGDVVAYRDPTGRLCHSGLVVGTNRRGEVLVESKWAWLGRIVHPAGVQPYAAIWGYYRSDRVGHDLASPPRPAGPDLASPRRPAGPNAAAR